MPSLLRFEGRTQEEARRRIREKLGGDARIVRAGKERSGGLFGFFQREVYVFEVERPSAKRPDAALAPLLAATIDRSESTLTLSAPVQTQSFASSFEEVLSEAEATIASATETEFDSARPAAPVPRVAAEPEPLSVTAAGCYERADLVRTTSEPTTTSTLSPTADRSDETTPDGVSPTPGAPSAAAGPLPERPPSGGGYSATELSALGLPEQVVGLGRDLSLTELVDAFGTLPWPPALPCGPGSLVVVVGRRTGADRLARALAKELAEPVELTAVTLGEDQDDRAPRASRPSRASGASAPKSDRAGTRALRDSSRPAARRPVLGPIGLAQLVAARRIEGRSTVLSVALPARGTMDGAVAALVAALRPDAVWAAVPADTSHSELDALAESLDAIALEGFMAAERPASLLGAGIPVGYVDGHRASALLVTALIAEHLERRSA